MSESQSTDPDKNRPSRSYGSVLLFFFVLIIILVFVGGQSMSQPTSLTQDEYLYRLYSGEILSQEFRGRDDSTTQIEGELLLQASAEPQAFRVEFANAKANEELFREVKARIYTTVEAEELAAGIESAFYEPRRAISITTVTEHSLTQPQPDRGVGDTTEPTPREIETRLNEKLFVEVLARSESDWTENESAPFPLPNRDGHQWYEVELDRKVDLAGLVGVLESRGALLERHHFALSKDRGTTFARTTSFWSSFLLFFGPWLLVFFVVMFAMRQIRGQGGAGGVMSFGRSRAQKYTKENRTNVGFDDVAGANEAKEEVREIVEFLKNPGRFTKIGGRIPRGVLLVGPPGCGKTLLAKAIAGEAEVPFFSISGSDFVEMFVGVGASRVRDLFKQARENSPCIIFLDEIDAVGRRRGSGMGGGHDEREQTLNAILVEMDGFATDEGIIVVAATNRPDVLDPALLRPGRFDREVTIDLPDVEGRKKILEVHLGRVKHTPDVDTAVLARSTPGYSGADLAAIVNEAAIAAVLAKRDEVAMEDMEEARDKVRYGRQKISRQMEEEDRKVTAYHEAGHAVIAAVLEDTDPPHKVTIVPRGRALGATMVLPTKESFHTQRKRLLANLAMLFGGRIAEAEFCGDISAGASDDIRRATELARTMVSELGMSEKIGPIHYAERQGSDFLGAELGRGKLHSEETAREIDREVADLLQSSYRRAEELIRSHRDAMEQITQALLELETITGQEVLDMVAGKLASEVRPEKAAEPEPTRPREAAPPRATDTDEGELGGELPSGAGLSPA